MSLAEVTKERLRRAIGSMQKPSSGGPLLAGLLPKHDLGFRAFKLAESNFTTWDATNHRDPAALERQLELHVSHLREGRTDEDILFELLLKAGFPLTTQVETLSLAGKTVYDVQNGMLLICLDRDLTPEVITAMANRGPARVICLDEGFVGNDQLKANAVQTMKTKGVVKFQTV
jgi:adenine-specific DNA-methyltransferase